MTPDQAVTPTAASAQQRAATEPLVQLGDVFLAVLRARRLIALLSLVGVIAGIAWALIPLRTWTAEATFLPEQRRQSQGGISGLASQIGISVGGLDGAQPGVLFVELARSPLVLDSIAHAEPFAPPSGSAALAKPLEEWLRIDETDLKRRRLALRNSLATAIDASSSPKTGLVTVKVTLPSDWLAAEVARRLIRQLDRVSIGLRQRRAQHEKRFTDERMAESAEELLTAERRVTNFQVGNRDISRSPERQLELERLSREASLRQQLFASLANAAQQASLERQRDTPAVTVLQPPDLPLQPDRRFLVRKTLVGAFGGMALAILIALLRHFWFTERRAASDQLDLEWRRSRYDLVRPWRLLLGSRSSP